MDKDTYITAFFILASLFMILYTGAAGGTLSDMVKQYTNIIYIILLLFAGLVFQLFQRTGTKSYVSFGKTRNAMLAGFVASIIGVVIIFGSSLKMATPLSTGFGIDIFLASLYIAIVIPFSEEKVFGQIVPYLMAGVVGNPYVAALLTAGLFAGFHLFAFGIAFNLLLFSFLFRLLITFANEKFGSSIFGVILHYTNNILVIFRG